MLDKAHLRIARPTNNLAEVVKFYRDALGFEILSSFEDHQGFDGVILGHPGLPYHLEFTVQRGHDAPKPQTQENLLVFYMPERNEWQTAVDRMVEHGYEPVKSHNPYWDMKGKTFEDIDGYRVVLQNASWN